MAGDAPISAPCAAPPESTEADSAAGVRVRVLHALSGELVGQHFVDGSMTIGRLRCEVHSDWVRTTGKPTRGRVGLLPFGSSTLLHDASTVGAVARDEREAILELVVIDDVVDELSHFEVGQHQDADPAGFFRKRWPDFPVLVVPGFTVDHLVIAPEGKAFVFTWGFQDLKLYHTGELHGMRWQVYSWHARPVPRSELDPPGLAPSEDVTTVLHLTLDQPSHDVGRWPEELLLDQAQLQRCRAAPGRRERMTAWIRWTAGEQPVQEVAEMSSAPAFLPQVSPRQALCALFLDFLGAAKESGCWSLRRGALPDGLAPAVEAEDALVSTYTALLEGRRQQASGDAALLAAALASLPGDLEGLRGALHREDVINIEHWCRERAPSEPVTAADEAALLRYCRAEYWQPWAHLRQSGEAGERDREVREEEETGAAARAFALGLESVVAQWLEGRRAVDRIREASP